MAMSEPQRTTKPAVLLPTGVTENRPAARRTAVPSNEDPLETVKVWLGLTPRASGEKRERGWGDPIEDDDPPDLVVLTCDWDVELDGDWDKYLL